MWKAGFDLGYAHDADAIPPADMPGELALSWWTGRNLGWLRRKSDDREIHGSGRRSAKRGNKPTPEEDAKALGYLLGESGAPNKPPAGMAPNLIAAFTAGWTTGHADADECESFHRDEMERDVLTSSDRNILGRIDLLIDERDLYPPGATS